MSYQWIERKCPVCESSSHEPLFKKETLSLVRCTTCSMIFANPIEQGWASGAFYGNLAEPFYLSADKLESDYAPVRFARELKLFRRFCREGSVLDVGCSTGAFLYQLKTRFPDAYRVSGMDVAGPALDYAEQKGIRALRESFPDADFKGETFSAITFWAVIEHLLDPRAFLAKAASLLQPSGYCFILVPNFKSLAVRLLGAKYRYIFPQHVNYFTLSTLKKLVATQPQLRVIASTSTHFNPIVILQDRKSTGGFVADEDRAKLLKRTTGYKQNPALQPVKLALSGVESFLGATNLADNIVLVVQRRT
jgi:2-polyprenyl-3-methyl-5-hydroxy-6-metoxy-1,4-benzoquinol methylase